MDGRIKSALEAYEKANYDIFTAADLKEVDALADPGDKFDLVYKALMAGYMIGQGDTVVDILGQEAAQKPLQHYVSYKYSIEEMDEAARDYENTPAGKQFTKRLHNAREFYFKHSKGGLLWTQCGYLANKHHNSLLNSLMDVSSLAYRTGYNAGKEAAKK